MSAFEWQTYRVTRCRGRGHGDDGQEYKSTGKFQVAIDHVRDHTQSERVTIKEWRVFQLVSSEERERDAPIASSDCIDSECVSVSSLCCCYRDIGDTSDIQSVRAERWKSDTRSSGGEWWPLKRTTSVIGERVCEFSSTRLTDVEKKSELYLRCFLSLSTWLRVLVTRSVDCIRTKSKWGCWKQCTLDATDFEDADARSYAKVKAQWSCTKSVNNRIKQSRVCTHETLMKRKRLAVDRRI